MNKLKKLYRDFFGLTEQSTPGKGAVKMSKATNPAEIKKMTDQGLDVKLENEKPRRWQDNDGDGKWYEDEDVNEAQLVNNITDYRGGVEYVLRDPAEAKAVAQEIREWAERKGFTVVKHTISPTGKVGYFYSRLGQDPGRESQRIQGYIAQKPEIKHFRFNVRGDKKIAQRTTPPAPENI
jgi:hypothetical protein